MTYRGVMKGCSEQDLIGIGALSLVACVSCSPGAGDNNAGTKEDSRSDFDAELASRSDAACGEAKAETVADIGLAEDGPQETGVGTETCQAPECEADGEVAVGTEAVSADADSPEVQSDVGTEAVSADADSPDVQSEEAACPPDCAGKECGLAECAPCPVDAGCSASRGECPEGEACYENKCLAAPPPPPTLKIADKTKPQDGDSSLVTVTIEVTNFDPWPAPGKKYVCHLDGVPVGEGQEPTFAFPSVPFGLHRLACELDLNGVAPGKADWCSATDSVEVEVNDFCSQWNECTVDECFGSELCTNNWVKCK